jgi:NAD(P)-dependent dehydrogenase (short-subunit alcohol dehydrogenase family)
MVKHVNVVIIGCSSGLGKHLAMTYGIQQNVYQKEDGGQEKETLNMVLVSRRTELLEELKGNLGNLERLDRNIEIITQDITKDGAAKNIIDKTVAYFNSKSDHSKIDHLICNAGILVKASPKQINLKEGTKTKYKDTWIKLYNTNYLAHRNIVEYAINEGEGESFLSEKANIAFTNSIEGKRYLPTPKNYFGSYGKSKKMLDKWITHSLRKKYGQQYNITVMYPSKIDTPMFFNILEANGTRTKRKPEWRILGIPKEPYIIFNNYKIDGEALRYYLAIQNKKEEEYSSVANRLIIKYLPEPFCFWVFYPWSILKNLTLVDRYFYLLLQFPFELPIVFGMVINNFYIKENVITQEDIDNPAYKLKEIKGIKNDNHILYRYYIINTIILGGIGFYINKNFNQWHFPKKIGKIFQKIFGKK